MGNVLVFKKVTPGIQSKSRGYANNELYDLAVNNNFRIPRGYALSQVDLPMLMNDFMKFVKNRPWEPDKHAWINAVRLTTEQNAPYLKGRVLSYSEAKARAERSKSPGAFWNKYFKSKGEVYDDPFGDRIVETTIREIMNGNLNINTWHQSSPKIEVRPLEKLTGENPKVRVFMCCDIIFYTVGIMLYGDQNDHFLEAWDTRNYSAVGVSLQYGCWNKLFRCMTEDLSLEEALKEIFHSFDISGMEATLLSEVFDAIYIMRNANLLVPPKYARYYLNLQIWYLKVLFYAYVIDPHGFLILMFGGNPSGGFNTLTDNGFAQMLYTNYSLAIHERNYDELRIFASKFMWVKMVGDDSLFRDHKYISFYCQDLLSLGVVINYETTPGNILTQKLCNCGFIYAPRYGMVVPGANIDKMLANVFYNMKRNSWRLAYVKLQALLFFTQVFPELHYQIQIMIKYVEDYHLKDMEKEPLDEILTLNATLQQAKTTEQLKFLMFGLNGESSMLQFIENNQQDFNFLDEELYGSSIIQKHNE